MAMSGSIQTSPAIVGDTFQLRWSATRNGRVATISWDIYKNSSTYVYVGPVSVDMAWANRYYYGPTRDYQWYAWTVMASGRFTIGYDSAGNCSFPISLSIGSYNNSYNTYNTWASDTVYLDNIGYEVPIINSITLGEVTTTTVDISVTYDTKSASIITQGFELSIDGGTNWTFRPHTLNTILTELIPNTNYKARALITTSGGTARSSIISFTTLADSFCRIINSDGTISDKKKMYLIDSNGKKEIIKQKIMFI